MNLLRSAFVGILSAIPANLLGFTAGYWFARQQNQRTIYWIIILTLPAIIPLILYGMGFLQFVRPFGFARTLTAVVIAHTVIFSPVVLALSFGTC